MNCSMPECMPRLLKRLNHPEPTKPQYTPHPAPTITCGSKVQYALKDDSPKLLNEGIKLV